MDSYPAARHAPAFHGDWKASYAESSLASCDRDFGIMPDTTTAARVPAGTDLVEWYFDQGWTDGLPVVPPTGERVAACIAALGGEPEFLECRVPPRYGGLTREVLAVNMVMAGCKPEYAPVVRAALLALTANAFNLNG